MPVIFIGHGNPMYAIEPNRFANAWAELGRELPRPAAVLVNSGTSRLIRRRETLDDLLALEL